ncbi:MAG: hypothetical protein IT385_03320 [Deltaproteobacteria bacterium]|nr:hypothetical protein [Deltaproteobacteria bacterium]
MSKLGAAFARLSKREKIMVGGLAVLVVGGLVFVLSSIFQSRISKLETDIAAEQDALRQIYAGTETYLAASTRFEAAREKARANTSLTLTTSVATLADEITFEAFDTRNNPMGRKHLKEFLEFGALREKPVAGRKKETKPGAKKDEGAEGYVQRDQEFTVKGTVPFAAIYELFEKVEESQDTLFVTEVRLDRNSIDADRADNVKFTVSTIYFHDDAEAP